jgi:hypothetical protein
MQFCILGIKILHKYYPKECYDHDHDGTLILLEKKTSETTCKYKIPRKVSFMDNISGEIYSEGITFLWIVFMQYHDRMVVGFTTTCAINVYHH